MVLKTRAAIYDDRPKQAGLCRLGNIKLRKSFKFYWLLTQNLTEQ